MRRDWSPVTRLTFFEQLIVLWEIVLIVGGSVGLVLLSLHYRRPFSRRGWAFARIWTYILCTCYASMHLYSFVLEWI